MTGTTAVPANEFAEIRPTPSGAPEDPASELPLTVIVPRSGWQVVDLHELWHYRELLFSLTWRDIAVRYKQTVLGAAWALLQPLATMLVFSLFFGRVASAPGSAVPYPLFVLTGLVPWMFFANAISSAGQSVVGNERLITKIYFPRLIIPFSAAGAALADLGISLALLFAMMLAYGVSPGVGLLVVPLVILGLVVAALGIGTLLAALTVAYRDFRHVVPFLIQLWMFATPVIYLQAGHVIGPRWRWLMPMNPAYGLIDNFRRAMLNESIDPYSLSVSWSVGLVLLLIGVLYFRRVEQGFADII